MPPASRPILIAFVVLPVILAYLWRWSLSPAAAFLEVQEGDAIVVTGSHTGIGKHAALTLAQHGFTVFCGVRKPEHGQELIEAAKKYDIDTDKVKPIILDVTKPEQIDAAVETVTQFVGRKDRGLYGLFNNAGIGNHHPNGNSVENFPMEEYRRVFEVNYFGLLQTTKAFLPLLRRGKGGRILSNTSVAGIFAGPFCGAYCSSKFAVEALSDSLRRELHPHGVKVSVLQPGFIKTPILQGFSQSLSDDALAGNIYASREIVGQRKAAKIALEQAASPRVTSDAVVHAMRSVHPKTRYVVGGMSGIVRFLASLPDSWVDFLMMCVAAGDEGGGGEAVPIVTEEEMESLLAVSRDTAFEL